MAERKTLADVKATRAWTPAMQAAYDKAGAAYELGERVRRLREETGLSQRGLAERMGTTQSVVARLEGGGAEPTLPTLRRLAAGLGRTLVIDFKDDDSAVTRERHTRHGEDTKTRSQAVNHG